MLMIGLNSKNLLSNEFTWLFFAIQFHHTVCVRALQIIRRSDKCFDIKYIRWKIYQRSIGRNTTGQPWETYMSPHNKAFLTVFFILALKTNLNWSCCKCILYSVFLFVHSLLATVFQFVTLKKTACESYCPATKTIYPLFSFIPTILW